MVLLLAWSKECLHEKENGKVYKGDLFNSFCGWFGKENAKREFFKWFLRKKSRLVGIRWFLFFSVIVLKSQISF